MSKATTDTCVDETQLEVQGNGSFQATLTVHGLAKKPDGFEIGVLSHTTGQQWVQKFTVSQLQKISCGELSVSRLVKLARQAVMSPSQVSHYAFSFISGKNVDALTAPEGCERHRSPGSGDVLALSIVDGDGDGDEQRFWFPLPQTRPPMSTTSASTPRASSRGSCASCTALGAEMKQLQSRVQELQLKVARVHDHQQLQDMSVVAVKRLEELLYAIEGAELAELSTLKDDDKESLYFQDPNAAAQAVRRGKAVSDVLCRLKSSAGSTSAFTTMLGAAEKKAEQLALRTFPSTIVTLAKHTALLSTWLGRRHLDVSLLYCPIANTGNIAAEFHSKCNGKGATLTIVRTKRGSIFGAYTSTSWTSSGGYKPDPNAFLFALGPKPGKMTRRGTNQEMYDHPSYGPSFGANQDLLLHPNCMTQASATSHVGSAFAPIPEIGAHLDQGTQAFQVDALEVFSVN